MNWTPYILAASSSPASCHNRCGNKKQKVCNDEKSSIIHQDRSSRIQYIDGNKVEFSLDLPGIKASDTKVEIHDGVLKVEAERKRGDDRTTKIQRSFSVKDIVDLESDDLHANLEDGGLRITIPKKTPDDKEEEISTSIPVEAGYPTETNESASDTKVHFSVDLPGVSLSNVTLEVKNDTVSVHATRTLFDRESTTKRYFTIDTDKVDASTLKGYLADGVLTVIGSKRVVPGPKQIVVTTGPAVSAEMIVEKNETGSKDEDDLVIVETVADKAKEE